MDKLVSHAIRMLEIAEGENDFFRNDAKRQADIARAVYDTILRVQVLERIADHKTENSSEKPNNCEHITEDGVTCAKYPACDDCPDNTLNKVKGSERLVKGKDEPTCSKMEQVEDDAYFLELMGAVERGEISDAGANQAWYEYINHKDEPQTERSRDEDRR